MSEKGSVENNDLVAGVEISRKHVRVAIYDSIESCLVDFIEVNLEPVKDENKSGFLEIYAAIEKAWEKLSILGKISVAIAVGTRHSGVGSGPQIDEWITSLESSTEKRITRAGNPQMGVSYFPLKHIHEMTLIFNSLPAQLKTVELAPISIARLIGKKLTCTFKLDSSVGWSARMHSGYVLEALAYPEGLEVSGIEIDDYEGKGFKQIANGGIFKLSQRLENKNLEFSDVAISVGAAKGLITKNRFNLLSGIDKTTLEEDIKTLEPVIASSRTTQELKIISSTREIKEKTASQSPKIVISNKFEKIKVPEFEPVKTNGSLKQTNSLVLEETANEPPYPDKGHQVIRSEEPPLPPSPPSSSMLIEEFDDSPKKRKEPKTKKSKKINWSIILILISVFLVVSFIYLSLE